MNMKRLSFQSVSLFVLVILLAGFLLSCAPEDTGPKAWIDFPIDGSSLPAGTPVGVISHAFARPGVAEVMLMVNGEPNRRGPPTQVEGSFCKTVQEWRPDKAGDYVLQVRAYDTTGQASSPALVRVKVLGEVALVASDTVTVVIPAGQNQQITVTATRTPTLTPTGTRRPTPTFTPTYTPTPSPTGTRQPTPTFTPTRRPTPTFTPTRQPTPTFTPTRQPTPTFTPTRRPTPTFTPPPPAQVNFRADQTTIDRAKCTMLRWDVENATAVYLNGEGVAGHGTRQVCPTANTVYTLHVDAARGGGDRTVTITVNVPRDTTPPPAPAPAVPANGLKINCRSTQTLAWIPVQDPSNIAGYYVKLERQVKQGQWQSVRGWGPLTDKQVTASVQCGIFYRWAVRAQDGAGNIGDWSNWSAFSLTLK